MTATLPPVVSDVDRAIRGRLAIVCGDARHLPLADNSVDLIVTSPPYYGLRSYVDGGEHYAGQIGSEPTPSAYIDALIVATREWMRVLKSGGSLWVNLGDSYYSGKGAPGHTTIDQKSAGRTARRTGISPLDASGLGLPRKSLVGLPWRYALACIDDLGLTLRAEVVWDKPNALPESVTDRVRRSHETWFHLTVAPRYYSAVNELREPHQPESYRPSKKGSRSMGGRDASLYHSPSAYNGPNPMGKLPGSVWTIASQPLIVPPRLGINHFAAFPMEWPRRLIKGWCPSDGVVLDPFGGTGTTALVASVLGRIGVTVDASADYCRLAQWRCSDPCERAKAAQVDKPPAEVPGQGDLFGAVS